MTIEKDLLLKLEAGLSFSFSEEDLFHISEDSPPILVEGGKIYGIYGPNGSGKTTLLNLINGFLCPQKSIIFFWHEEKRFIFSKSTYKEKKTPIKIANLGHKELEKHILLGSRFHEVRRIFQLSALPEELSILDSLLIVKRNFKKESLVHFLNPKYFIDYLKTLLSYDKKDIEKGIELLKEFGFKNPNEIIEHLSYGEKRIITVLQMIFSNAGVLLLDEPFANIHIEVINKLKKKLKSYVNAKDDKRAIILIEHRKEYLDGFVDSLWKISNREIVVENQF